MEKRIRARSGAMALLLVMMMQSVVTASFEEEWPVFVERTERAYLHGDAVEAVELRTELRGWLDEPDRELARVEIVRYTVAYLDWRLALFSEAGVNVEGDPAALLDEAVELLRENIEADEEDAESHALLSAVYGLQVAGSARGGMLRGTESGRAIDRAMELSPANPRVLFLNGVGKFHTPQTFGGGEDRAERLLRRAVAAFRTEPPDRPWPRWGLVDVHAWLGIVAERRGDRAAARTHYEDALRIEPEFDWVKRVLLPNLAPGGERQR